MHRNFHFTLILGALFATLFAGTGAAGSLLEDLECADLVEYQLLLKSAALEGWALKIETLDAGKTRVVTRALVRAGIDGERHREVLRRFLGLATTEGVAVAITGHTVEVLAFSPGMELTQELLNEMYRQLRYAGIL